MKIVCPSCQAQYEVPEVVQTSRRKMRCARCGSEWVPADMALQPAPQVAAEPLPHTETPAEVNEAPPEPDVERKAPQEPALADEVAGMAPPDVFLPERTHEPTAVRAPDVARAPAAVPIEPAPRPLVLRAATPVTLRTSRPDPAAIIVPPAAKGQPLLAWTASIALVVVLAAAAVIYRAPIMKAWPPSTRLYVSLGLV